MNKIVREKAFYKKLLAIAVPVALQQVVTAGVNMVDTIMLGKLGDVALSASANGTQVHTFFLFIMIGISGGTSVMVSRYWGARDMQDLKKTISIAYRIAIVFGLLYTIPIALFPEKIISMLTNDPDVISAGAGYLRWTIPCFFLHGITQLTSFLLRNMQQAYIPLYSSIAAFAVNIGANWIFIFGKFGAPAMGVSGAALGTTISRLFEFIFIVGYFFLKNKKIKYKVRDIFKTDARDLYKEYVRIVTPVLISDTVLGLGNSITVAIAGRAGRAYMTANSITNVVRQGTRIFTTGLAQGASIIIGNTLGEGRQDDAKKQGFTIYLASIAMGLLCCILIMIFGPIIVSSYEVTPESHDAALQLMNSIAIVMIVMSPAMCMTRGVLRGGGDTRFLMVADAFFLWVLSIPLGYAAALIWKLPPFFIFLCLRSDEIFKAIVTYIRFSSGKWMKKIKTQESEMTS